MRVIRGGVTPAPPSQPNGDGSTGGTGGGTGDPVNANPDGHDPDDPRPPDNDGGGADPGPDFPSWFNCQRGGILPSGQSYPPAPAGMDCETYYNLLLGYMRGDADAIRTLRNAGVTIRTR